MCRVSPLLRPSTSATELRWRRHAGRQKLVDRTPVLGPVVSDATSEHTPLSSAEPSGFPTVPSFDLGTSADLDQPSSQSILSRLPSFELQPVGSRGVFGKASTQHPASVETLLQEQNHQHDGNGTYESSTASGTASGTTVQVGSARTPLASSSLLRTLLIDSVIGLVLASMEVRDPNT